MGIDQHDAALWTIPQRAALHRLGTAWRLETTTFVGALHHDRLPAPMVADEPIDGEMFLAWIQPFLCPTLQPADIVILDNLRSHKVAGVRQAIEAAGATLLYLPPTRPISTPSKNSSPSSRHCSEKPPNDPSTNSGPR